MGLINGTEKPSNPERNLQDVEGLAARLDELDYNDHAAVRTSQIRAELAKAGKPIDPYDQMIANHA